MTSGERKALAFLAGIGMLGAAGRAATAPSRAPSHAERLALAGQIDAVDSARRSDRAGRRSRDAAGSTRSRRPRAATDSINRRSRRPSTSPSTPMGWTLPSAPPPAPSLVDVDVADLTTLDALPGIGPGLARRIAEDRAERGPFGSLSELQRVRGVGKKLAGRLAPYVTFSGVRRPSSAALVRLP